MGEAKCRKAQIAELKKTPRKPRGRLLKKLSTAKTEQVFHFRSEAARRASDLISVTDAPLRNSDQVTRAVRLGQVEQQFVQAIPLKIMTPTVIESSRPPRQPHPFPLAVGCKEAELAHYVVAMGHISPNGNGFRQPSTKAKNWRSTSLAEQLAIRWLDEKPNPFKRSDRGNKKLERRNESNAIIVLDRLIEQWPDRAAQAKHNERMFNWFVGKAQHAYPDLNADWLNTEAKERIKRGGRAAKYRHSYARDFIERAEAA